MMLVINLSGHDVAIALARQRILKAAEEAAHEVPEVRIDVSVLLNGQVPSLDAVREVK